MHRDTKLGLALGILLVGIVGAFFFRNERPPHHDAPALQDPQALDVQIAEKPITPYLMPPEFPDGPAPAATSDPAVLLASDPSWTDAAGPPAPISTDGRLADPSIVRRNRADDLTGPTVPNPNRAWEGVDVQPPATAAPTAAAPAGIPTTPITVTVPAAPAGLEYRVRPGDTLSDLAARHLGSSTRFMEIYEANRDLLKSPNDLRAGMTIRIPAPAAPSTAPAGPPVRTISAQQPTPPPAVVQPTPAPAEPPAATPTPTTKAAPAATAPPDESEAVEAPRPEKPRLFTPVRRPPLLRGIGATDPTSGSGHLADLPADHDPNATRRRY